MTTMAKRINEAVDLVRRYSGTHYHEAATAYLEAQVEQARKAQRAVAIGGAT